MSLTSLFTVLLGFLTITGTNSFSPSRIVNGGPVEDHEFPFSVSLKDQYGHFCGGTIISSRHVLTAGHCLANQSPKSFKVTCGVDWRNDVHAITNEVHEFHMHPHYVDYSVNYWLENDIAVITLKKKLDLDGVRLKAAKLPISQYMDKTDAVSIGFGPTSIFTANTGNFAARLQKVNMRIDNKLCDLYSHKPWGEFMCGWNSEGTLCGGDSGSPLVVGDTVIGITSSSVCQPGGVAVYTNVFHFKAFIRDILFKEHALH